MFKTLKAMFGNSSPAYPAPVRTQSTAMHAFPVPQGAGMQPETGRRWDDLLDPANPVGLTSVISPLHPCSPMW